MVGNFNVRYKVALVWVVGFVSIWIIFRCILPLKSIGYQLDKIEESIENKDWNQAEEYTSELINNFRKNRVFIQMNNATEALTNYEHTIGQLEITVKHKQESSLEYIGALREATNLVIKPFSGP